MLKCNSCGGEYEPILPDGTQYFHACPPLTARELSELLDRQVVQLRPADQRRLDAAIAADAKDPRPAGETPRAREVLEQLTIERPNKRDENVTGAAKPGERAPMKSDGAGVTRI